MVFMAKIQLKKTRFPDKKINSLTGMSGINIGGNCVTNFEKGYKYCISRQTKQLFNCST
jgi:hypothetical protein